MPDNRGMPRSSTHRRLMTVLFLDIVGSTALAHELGDARWRVVLTNFRAAVRHELKRYGGREQGTEGDSFFATFTEPVQALRAAAAIVGAVQDVGLDVRSGVHTGEVEELDRGGLGGIGVHIGARVCALAGPAEVMVTSTVKELVAGSGAVFDGIAPVFQQAEGAFEFPAKSEQRTGVLETCGQSDRRRGITAGAADEARLAKHNPHHEIVQPVHDVAIMEEPIIGNRGQTAPCILIVRALRLLREIAAGHDKRPVDVPQQQMVQGRIGKHEPESRIARSHGLGHVIGTGRQAKSQSGPPHF